MKYLIGLCILMMGMALVACNALATPIAPATATPQEKVLGTRVIEPVQTPTPGALVVKPPLTPSVKSPITPGVKPPLTPGVKPPITPPGNFAANGKAYSVTNPTTNAELHVQVFVPADATTKKYPALILVPGGTGDSGGMLQDAAQIMPAGFVVVVFDPDGRGKSGGVEDFNGYKHQDGLAAVARFAATLPEVDAKKIGIVTYSYGITMGAGVLARYPDLPIKFLIDWEGPVDRDDTTVGCRNDGNQRLAWKPCSDNGFWSEREALTFIAKVRVPYQRIQSEKDHVQPDVSHAINIINAAVQAKLAFVRLNDYPANQMYDVKNPPTMFAESQDRQRNAFVVKYALELANR